MSRPEYWRLCAPLALCFVLLQSTLAAPPQTAASTQQAVVLLQKSLAALVGNASLSDITLSGTARRIAGLDDEAGSFTFQALSGGSSKLQLNFATGMRTETRAVTDNLLVGSWSGPDRVTHSIAYHNLENRTDILPAFLFSHFATSANLSIVLIGLEDRDGKSAYHLSIHQQFPQLKPKIAQLAEHLTQTEIFLDSSTLLPVAINFNTHPDDDALIDIPVELQFTDYRPVGGVQVPFHIQKSLNGSLILDLQFEKATLNSGLSATVFSLQ